MVATQDWSRIQGEDEGFSHDRGELFSNLVMVLGSHLWIVPVWEPRTLLKEFESLKPQARAQELMKAGASSLPVDQVEATFVPHCPTLPYTAPKIYRLFVEF